VIQRKTPACGRRYPARSERQPREDTMRGRHRCKAGLVALTVAAFAPVAQATAVSFTKIAELGSAWTGVALNAAGEVAFGEQQGNRQLILRGAGAALTTIADFPLGTPYLRPAIGGSGRVAFEGTSGFLPDGTPLNGIFAGDGLAPAVRLLPGSLFAPVMDAGDAVVAGRRWPGGTPYRGSAIQRWQGGATTTIAQSDHADYYAWSLSDTGWVAYAANFVQPSGQGAWTLEVSDGVTSATWVDSREPGPFEWVSMLSTCTSINAAGRVAFNAELDGGSQAIYLVDSLGATAVATDGGDFVGFGCPRLNNLGEVAFVARLASGPVGLFDGSDALLDRIIVEGDGLDGSTVVGLGDFAFNDAGQLAFVATLADGRSVVFRAETVGDQPVSEGPVLPLVVLAASAGAAASRRTWIARRR
jgi:hypothetical protein